MWVVRPRVIWTGSCPRGVNLRPDTPLGVMLEPNRLLQCSPSCCITEGPATEMSAPESGSAFNTACPLRVEIWTAIVGAGSYCWSFSEVDLMLGT